jgi:hypothetical protein
MLIRMKNIPAALENPTGDPRYESGLIRSVEQRNEGIWG